MKNGYYCISILFRFAAVIHIEQDVGDEGAFQGNYPRCVGGTGIRHLCSDALHVAAQRLCPRSGRNTVAATCSSSELTGTSELSPSILRPAFMSLPLTAEAPFPRLSITALQK